jgi:hypothetical protein
LPWAHSFKVLAMYSRFSIGQIIGMLIFGATCNGLPLAGFHGGTGWSVLGWVALAFFGGFVGGLLMAPANRLSGAVGGMIAGPMGLLAVYFYARNRQTVYTAETAIVMLIASLPGLGVYWILRLLGNAIFPPPPQRYDDDDDFDDEEDRPRRRRSRNRDDDDEDDGPRRHRRRRRDEDEDEEEDDDSPRNRRRRDLGED